MNGRTYEQDVVKRDVRGKLCGCIENCLDLGCRTRFFLYGMHGKVEHTFVEFSRGQLWVQALRDLDRSTLA